MWSSLTAPRSGTELDFKHRAASQHHFKDRNNKKKRAPLSRPTSCLGCDLSWWDSQLLSLQQVVHPTGLSHGTWAQLAWCSHVLLLLSNEAPSTIHHCDLVHINREVKTSLSGLNDELITAHNGKTNTASWHNYFNMDKPLTTSQTISGLLIVLTVLTRLQIPGTH